MTPASLMSVISPSVWKDVLGQIGQAQPHLVRRWFGEIATPAMRGGVLEIKAANQAQSRYLRRHCHAAFLEAAQAATGRLITIDFDAPEDSRQPEDLPPSYNDPIPLNPDATFDNFVAGPCNRLAHAAALAVAEDPGQTYNPLFVHGPVGLGKTHLLQAICHAAGARNSNLRHRYLSCEMFAGDFIESVEQGALHAFRYRYRHVDLLIVDDVQFLAGRERSQEEFFHTFNTLSQLHKQIILSADCPPSEIPGLEERLVSRFNAGLVAPMDRPCFETRMAIVRKKTKLRCFEIPEDVVRFIASKIETNVRELEGAMTKIDALSRVESLPPDLPLARRALGDEPFQTVTVPAILEVVSQSMGVKVSDLQGRKRTRAIAGPRQISMYLSRELTPQSLENIGTYFGGRDHTTILHAHRSIAGGVKADPKLRSLVEQLAAEVKDAQP